MVNASVSNLLTLMLNPRTVLVDSRIAYAVFASEGQINPEKRYLLRGWAVLLTALRSRRTRIQRMYILLADNQAKERTMLRRLVGQEPELSVVGEASDARDLLAQAQVVHPDLVLLDWELPGLQGAGLLLALKCLGFP
jgi:hypothetical protein